MKSLSLWILEILADVSKALIWSKAWVYKRCHFAVSFTVRSYSCVEVEIVPKRLILCPAVHFYSSWFFWRQCKFAPNFWPLVLGCHSFFDLISLLWKFLTVLLKQKSFLPYCGLSTTSLLFQLSGILHNRFQTWVN